MAENLGPTEEERRHQEHLRDFYEKRDAGRAGTHETPLSS